MANLITNHKGRPAEGLMMNNGLTSVLFEVLVLAGSSIAQSSWEEELICWLAEHDQGVFGSGMVGFDLDEIAWTRDGFADQKEFFSWAIALAEEGHRWDVLPYRPDKESVREALAKLRRLLDDYTVDFVETEQPWSWRSRAAGETRCPRHDVLMHGEGCIICNDT